MAHKQLIKHSLNHFYKKPKTDKKHLDGDHVVRMVPPIPSDIYEFENRKKKKFNWAFDSMLRLSKFQAKGHNQKVPHLSNFLENNTVNSSSRIIQICSYREGQF